MRKCVVCEKEIKTKAIKYCCGCYKMIHEIYENIRKDAWVMAVEMTREKRVKESKPVS